MMLVSYNYVVISLIIAVSIAENFTVTGSYEELDITYEDTAV